MNNPVDLIQRTLASFQRNELPPRDVVREWIDGLTTCLDTPGVTLDEAMGFRPRHGKRRLWCEVAKQRRATLLQQFYQRHFFIHGISKYAASKLLAEDFEIIALGDSKHMPRQYRTLFDELYKLPVAPPKTAGQFYKYLSLPLKEVF